jgi:hypothetical protein
MKITAFLIMSTALTMAADKSAYHLFNPTPVGQMRGLSTDRPDQTESPYTVDAGHWQFEVDLLNWTHDDEDGVRTDSLALLPINVKLGLTSSTDIEFVFESWSQEKVRGIERLTRDGFGDLTVRLKQNLWGNDGGTTAFALLPYVTLPLDASDLGRDDTEAGLILPFGINLPHDLYLGLMTRWDWINDDAGGHRNAWVNSVSLAYPISEQVGGYLEFASTVYDDDAPWEGTVDAGFTWGMTDNLQFDIGCNVGVTKSAPDVQPFIGVSYRY